MERHEDFERNCPKCGRVVRIAADHPLQRGQCSGCGRTYGITERLGSQLDLLPVGTREEIAARRHFDRVHSFKRQIVLLLVTGIGFGCIIFGLVAAAEGGRGSLSLIPGILCVTSISFLRLKELSKRRDDITPDTPRTRKLLRELNRERRRARIRRRTDHPPLF